MRNLAVTILACATLASPSHAEPNLEKGFDGALRGCEEWVLNPASWVDGTAAFVETVGLETQMSLVDRVEEANLPPVDLRRANHYWRINSAPDAGYVLVVSDELPMCHITGGGSLDLRESVENVLSSAEFNERWQIATLGNEGGISTTVFRNREVPAMTMTISRANRPGKRLDEVQVVATAIYEMSS